MGASTICFLIAAVRVFPGRCLVGAAVTVSLQKASKVSPSKTNSFCPTPLRNYSNDDPQFPELATSLKAFSSFIHWNNMVCWQNTRIEQKNKKRTASVVPVTARVESMQMAIQVASVPQLIAREQPRA